MPLHDDIEEERTALMPEAEMLRRFREYTRGRQPGTLTIAQMRILRGLLGNRFSDNVCKMVVQELSNRLILARFDVPDQQVEEALRDAWVRNQMPMLSHLVHWSMFRDGAAAVGLDWLDGRPILSREPWWDGKKGVFVFFDATNQPRQAVKEWTEKKQQYRTVYYPDHMERYRKEGDGWKSYRLASDPTSGPVLWQGPGGEPLGVPFVPFINMAQPADGDESDGRYGVSELDGGLLGLQDEINDLHRDVVAAARFAGYQMIYSTGHTPATDDEGNEVALRVEPGAVFTNSNNEGRFGTLPAGSLAELERALHIKLQAVSRQSGVPTHLIGGDWPSGDALIQAERPLTDRTEASGRGVGPAWASVAHQVTTLLNAFGQVSLNTDALITSVFQSAEGRNPVVQAQIATARAPFISNREVLRLFGYSPADIERIEQERSSQREEMTPIETINVERARTALQREQQPATAGIADRLRQAGVEQGGAV